MRKNITLQIKNYSLEGFIEGHLLPQDQQLHCGLIHSNHCHSLVFSISCPTAYTQNTLHRISGSHSTGQSTLFSLDGMMITSTKTTLCIWLWVRQSWPSQTASLTSWLSITHVTQARMLQSWPAQASSLSQISVRHLRLAPTKTSSNISSGLKSHLTATPTFLQFPLSSLHVVSILSNPFSIAFLMRNIALVWMRQCLHVLQHGCLSRSSLILFFCTTQTARCSCPINLLHQRVLSRLWLTGLFALVFHPKIDGLVCITTTSSCALSINLCSTPLWSLTNVFPKSITIIADHCASH